MQIYEKLYSIYLNSSFASKVPAERPQIDRNREKPYFERVKHRKIDLVLNKFAVKFI